MVKSYTVAQDHEKISSLISFLIDDFAMSPQANHRKVSHFTLSLSLSLSINTLACFFHCFYPLEQLKTGKTCCETNQPVFFCLQSPVEAPNYSLISSSVVLSMFLSFFPGRAPGTGSSNCGPSIRGFTTS